MCLSLRLSCFLIIWGVRDYFIAKIHTLVIFTNLPNNNINILFHFNYKKQVGQILFILFYK